MRRSPLFILLAFLVGCLGIGLFHKALQATAQESNPLKVPVPAFSSPSDTSESIPLRFSNTPKTKHSESNTSPLKPGTLHIPTSISQGEVIILEIPESIAKQEKEFKGSTAWLAGHPVRFFAQKDGSFEALIPIAVDLKPKSYPLKIQDAAGSSFYSTNINVLDAHFRHQNIEVSKTVGGLQPEAGELDTVASLKTTLTDTKYWERPFLSPTPDCMNSPFGVLRYHNGVYIHDYHKGLDLRSPMGQPIRATAGGTVKIARFYRLHGGTVGIDHGQGVSSIYIHMSKIGVKPGDMVKKGDIIGNVGSTGFATGPHLHWGLFINGVPVNPTQWLVGLKKC